MERRVKITQPGDLPAATVAVLGFEPEDSLVVLATGLSLRMDLDTPESMALSLAPAMDQLRQGQQVIVLAYTTEARAAGHAAMVADWMRSVEVDVALYGVVGHGMVRTEFGDATYEPTNSRRSDLVTLAQLEADADDCDVLAWQSWRAGNGTLAWCYLDQAEALRGSVSESGAALTHMLTECIGPAEEVR